MNYVQLANLLYPDAVSEKYWECKYPARNLPQGAEVTRFAPSPTGYLHIGHFFQALCDLFIAKSSNGVFYFRVEDTDKKREIKNSIDVAIDTLNFFGIFYNEGVLKNGKESGNYGPYKQSERVEIYKSFAKKLVADGRAYPCFCDKADGIEEIKERRNEQLQENNFIEEKDACRDLSYEEVEKKINAGKPFALRFKSFGQSALQFKFVDEVKGEREIRQNSKDVILLKSDGLPVYAFAHAIDDHLMHTTLVVRGEEWYPSLASHLEIFDALGFPRVKYAHNPVICKLDENGNKRKISKRKDAEADMRYFISSGYPKEAILEYLLNLANSNFELWRKQNPLIPLEEFNFSAKKISSSNPMFDFDKLNDISKTIISKLSAESVFIRTLIWAEVYNKSFADVLTKNKAYAIKVFNIERDTPKPRKDIAKWEDVQKIWGFMFKETFEKKYELEDVNTKDLDEVISNYVKIYNSSDDKVMWFEKIKTMSSTLGYATDNKDYKQNPQNYKGNVALVCEYIRIAITGRKNAPDLYTLCGILGQEKVICRLKDCLDR